MRFLSLWFILWIYLVAWARLPRRKLKLRGREWVMACLSLAALVGWRSISR